ncbi:MAG: bifunctional DNA primase/polymerase [Thauera sp.]|jgi:hypothetical protein|nr:bifunctional DNA primase/polymerase [Thauera sp.]
MGALDELTDQAAAAIKLASLGLPVFPCDSDKKPLCAHGFKDATTDADQVRGWWDQYPYALPGVPTGKTTEIFVLDVDVKGGKDGYATLAQLGYEIPPTRSHKTQTGGGRHYLFHMPADAEIRSSAGKIGPGVDTRADGGYIVWWPAIGLPVDNAQELLPIPQWLLDAAAPHPPISGVSESDLQKTQKTQMTQQSSSVSSDSSVGEAITRHLPESIGERNRRLFDLARHLKGLIPDATKADLRAIVTEWHRLALPNIGTAGFTESWGDFQRGWDAVHTPYGSVLNRILGEIDMSEKAPESLVSLGYDDKAILLCRICKQLQANAGEGPFFISARQAGELIGIHFTDASKVLYALVADDVLELVKKGAGNVASRYRYIWPD